MKKIILVLVLLIAAAVPAVHYFIGTNVEKSFRAEIQEASESSVLSGIGIELVDYQRSLFDATAVTRLRLIAPESDEELAIDFRHHISHTPNPLKQVLATVDTELVLSDEGREALAPLFKDQAPLDATTRIFFDGHQEVALSSPAVNGIVGDKKNVSVDWKGLQGSAWQSADRSEVRVKMSSPGLVIREVAQESADAAETEDEPAKAVGKLGVMRLTELLYEADMRKGESGLWHGETSGSMAGFDFEATESTGETVKLMVDNTTMRTEQSESEGLVKANVVMKSNVITFNEYNLSNAVYDVAVENLDGNALKAWQSAMAEMMRQQPGAMADPLEPMYEQLPALVNAQPVFRINDLSVDSPMGRFAMDMDARIIGQWNEMLVQNPAMFATMVKANLNVSVPKAFVETSMRDSMRGAIALQLASANKEMSEAELESMVQQTVNQQLLGMQQQGYIEEVEGQFESHLVYEAGSVTINGVDASPLLGMMMQ